MAADEDEQKVLPIKYYLNFDISGAISIVSQTCQ